MHSKRNLIDIANWLDTDINNIKLSQIENVDISFFMNDINALMVDFSDYPKDSQKTIRIVNEIKQTKIVYPLYIEKNDSFNFVFKGRHRMIALYLLGYNKYPVCYVEKK